MVISSCEQAHRERIIEVYKYMFKVKRMLLSTEVTPRAAYYSEIFKQNVLMARIVSQSQE